MDDSNGILMQLLGGLLAPDGPKEWKEFNDVVKFIEFESVTGLHITGVGLINGRGKGDDCVSIGDGITDINITYVNCGPGHGISIGSLGLDGTVSNVSNIRARHILFNGTQNGARIKTYQKVGVKISNVLYSEMHGTSTSDVALNFNCSENVACTDIKLNNIDLTSSTRGEKVSSSCNNASGEAIGTVNPKSCLR
ncbi:polygalacturonase-like [Quercus robur]|uniref:polygalacturonase-like n=1 Tax=Quercus robur TaxID=38942 RepID=UPI002163FDF9|nr:polygalacturonase-like [Quercus robur]